MAESFNHITAAQRATLRTFVGSGLLSRRTLLKGLGAAVSLPVLDSMLATQSLGVAAEKAEAAGKGIPTRLAFVSQPNGVIQSAWFPKTPGTEFELVEALEALAPLRNDVIVFSGLAQDNGRAKGDGPGDHARSAASLLTGAHPVKTAGANIKVGMSADQWVASKIGHLTRMPSLEVGIEPGRTSGNCDSGYSCAYSNTISWKSESTPMAKEINPRLVFERLFGGEENDPKVRAKRAANRKSVLDVVAGDAAKLKEKLGQTDRQKIDEYFTSVREIETRIEQAEAQAKNSRPEMEIPKGIPKDGREHMRLLCDLLTVAFRTDSVRVATFMLANEGSNKTYPMVGVNEGHHEISHHRNEADKMDKLKKIDKYLIEQFAYLLQQMKSVKEGEGTLLDHSLVMFGNGLGDGNAHSHHNLPIILAGHGSGSVKPGRYIKLEKETPLNNLFLSLFDRMGAPSDAFGDSNGRLIGLEG
jgi:hypothetical protein